MPNEPAIERELIGSLVVEYADERLIEVVEVGDFAEDAAQILSEDQIEDLKRAVATFRQLGDIIKNTNGLRKFRYGAKGKGKRGGARVIYFYGGDHMPIYLVAIYPKSAKEDMTEAEKKAARKLIQALVNEYKPKRTPPKLKVVKSVKATRR